MRKLHLINAFALVVLTAGCSVPAWVSDLFTTPPTTPPTTSPVTVPVTVPVQNTATVWALGDSQGANSNDPARGLPWTQRIGDGIGNGADNMYGGGWTTQSTYTHETIGQRATAISSTHPVTEFIVMAGINDLTGGRSVPSMLDAVDVFADQAAARATNVTWVGVVPLPHAATIANREADRKTFNASLAQRFPGHYVDCSATMSDANGWLKSSYSLDPLNLHLNSAGEQALADCISGFRR